MPKSDYSKQIKATEDVVKDLAFQISSFLVKVMNNPAYKQHATKGIMTLLNQALKIVPAMLEEDALLYPEEHHDKDIHDQDEEGEPSGIVEKKADTKTKKKKKTGCDNKSGNAFHSKKDGKFIALTKDGKATEDYAYSRYFQDDCKERARGKKGTKQRLMLKPEVHKDCGRGDRENQGRGTWKCSTAEKTRAKVQEEKIKEHFERFL
jgi:hypothetical protein